MANSFSVDDDLDSGHLTLSNGASDVLIALLCLAGAQIAQTDWEVDVITWIATNDQSVFGCGVIGFDLNELGWQTKDFESQKLFLQSVVRAMRNENTRSTLSYIPDPEIADGIIDGFESLLSKFKLEHCLNEPLEWKIAPAEPRKKCSVHGIFTHVEGCVICNDR